MAYTSVRLYAFRNLRDGVVSIPASQVFLVGDNGQGKSNFIEAIYLLSFGASFRTRHDKELVRTGEDEMACTATYDAEGLTHEVSVRYQDGSKKIEIDGRTISDRRDMISRMPSVVFQHSDMGYINGPPEMQRYFLDQTLSLDSPSYIDDLRRYRKILKTRNTVLKEHSPGLLPVLDHQLAESGLVLTRRRREALATFNQVFAELFQAVGALEEPLQIEYRPSWKDLDGYPDVVRLLESKRQQELALGTTLSGPHRDKVLYRFGELDFTRVASTGQTRLAALILRLAQARYFRERTGRRPILLLDDVLLELDSGRRERFVTALPESEQRIFTFLPNEPWKSYQNDDTLVLQVTDGSIQ